MRHRKATLCVCALAAVTALSIVAEECVALRPGTVEVVLPARPFPAECFAAQEMTNFLSRVLGAPVPIVEDGGAACAARPPYRAVSILLGRAAAILHAARARPCDLARRI